MSWIFLFTLCYVRWISWLFVVSFSYRFFNLLYFPFVLNYHFLMPHKLRSFFTVLLNLFIPYLFESHHFWKIYCFCKGIYFLAIRCLWISFASCSIWFSTSIRIFPTNWSILLKFDNKIKHELPNIEDCKIFITIFCPSQLLFCKIALQFDSINHLIISNLSVYIHLNPIIIVELRKYVLLRTVWENVYFFSFSFLGWQVDLHWCFSFGVCGEI